jgi:hypothetical protein
MTYPLEISSTDVVVQVRVIVANFCRLLGGKVPTLALSQ